MPTCVPEPGTEHQNLLSMGKVEERFSSLMPKCLAILKAGGSRAVENRGSKQMAYDGS